jgi:hypothetical protein
MWAPKFTRIGWIQKTPLFLSLKTAKNVPTVSAAGKAGGIVNVKMLSAQSTMY